jgi:clan AA aspartic protease
MIAGRVTARREARLHVTVRAPGQQAEQIDVVIDTGFNGALALPSTVIEALRLRSLGARPVTLADGSTTVLNVYRARLVWHEQERTVLILRADGDPLLGMALLYGNRIVMDVTDGGAVTIDPLP